jgi:hypothetical protein
MEKRPAPVILKVKDVEESGKFEGIHENLPQMPSLCLIIGSVRSGKSNLLVNFFANPAFYKDRFDIVKIVSTTLGSDSKGKILSEHFDCMDHYEDGIIEEIKMSQSQYEEKKDRPTYALVLDDVLTKDFSKTNAVSFFATRFRHYIDMYVIATQTFRAVSGMIRNNAQAVLIGRQQNQKELEKIAEEFGSLVGGDENFMKMYKDVHKTKYQFMYLDLTSNPARVLRNFEEVLWEGDKD